MSKIKQNAQNATQEYKALTDWNPRQYSNQELELFDKKIRAKFTIEKEVDYPVKETVKLIDEIAFLKHVGALTKNGSVVIEEYKPSYGSGSEYHTWSCKYPTRYEYWENLIRQWHNYCGRKQYAIRSGLESTAEQMTVNYSYPELDDF